MAQMKEQIKAPEKIQLSNERDSESIRSTVQIKTLVSGCSQNWLNMFAT